MTLHISLESIAGLRLRQRLFEWLTSTRTAEHDDVRAGLLATVPEQKHLVVLGFVWTLTTAVAAVALTQAAWSIIWLVADICLVTIHTALLSRKAAAADQDTAPPYQAIVEVNALRFAFIGFGVFACLASGDIFLTVLSAILAVGFAGFIASREAGIPRFALVAILLLGVPFMLGMLASPLPWLFVIGLLTPLGIAAMYVLASMNFDMLVGMLRAEHRNRQLSLSDPLTGLPNRVELRNRLVTLCDRPRALGAPGSQGFALLSLDLDGFKDVNDTLGHVVGDKLLIEVAQRLSACVPPMATVARLGGDEFVILLPGIGDPLGASEVADKAIHCLEIPFCIEDHDVYISASCGIALCPDHGSSADEMVCNADLALYQAKVDGRGHHRTFYFAMRQAAVTRRINSVEVRRAIDNNELCLYYQPQIRLGDGALVGAEALIRWRHPERGLVPPAAFLPSLEGSLLAATVGDWVLETACRQLAEWSGRGLPRLRMAVNLSAAQFRVDLLAKVRAVLERTGLAPDTLELEITENIILDHDDAVLAPLRELRAMGVGIALDDYGTGYASLSVLKGFPLSRLKIDQTFVRGMCDTPEDAAIIDAILQLGRRFGLDVIAEGVETNAQQEQLRRIGCAEAQGYLFGKPMPPEVFAANFGIQSSPGTCLALKSGRPT